MDTNYFIQRPVNGGRWLTIAKACDGLTALSIARHLESIAGTYRVLTPNGDVL